MRRPKPVRPEVLPAHPELEGAPAPRALEGQLVPVERILLVVRGAVVLGPPVERLLQVGPAPDQEPADVVGLEEPLVGVDRDRVGPGEVGDARPVAAGEERRAAVGRVDVEPEPVACGHVGQLPGGVDASRVGASGDAADGKWSAGPPRGRPRPGPPPRRRAAGSARRTARRPGCRAGSPGSRAPWRSRSGPGRTRRRASPRERPRAAVAGRGAGPRRPSRRGRARSGRAGRRRRPRGGAGRGPRGRPAGP